MQDKTLLKIGEYQLNKENYSKPYEVFIQNMYTTDNYKMLEIIFKVNTLKSGYKFSYEGIDTEEVSKKNYLRYAYREGTSKRSGDETISTKLGDIDKRINNIKSIQLKKLIKFSEKYPDENIFFNIFQESFLKNEKEILNDLKKSKSGIDKKEKVGLTVVFEIDGKKKYLYEFKTIQNILFYAGTEKLSEKYNVKSEGKEQICSVCQNKKNKLHGFANPLTFYTVDKPGFAANFFKQEASWKNYPICSDCAIKIEKGLDYIENNLSRSFWGYPYYIIPRVVYDPNNNYLIKALEVLNKYKYNSKDKISYYEDNFLKLISSEENYFFIDLFFYQKNNSEFSIKLMLEEIFPSRLRLLFSEVPSILNKKEIFKEVLTRKEGKTKVKKDIEFNFGVLKTFFSDDFYDLIYRVFIGKKIEAETLYNKFIKAIKESRNEYFKKGSYYVDEIVYKAIMTLYYFQELELINYNKNFTFEVKMEKEIKKETTKSFNLSKLLKFIEENKSFLDSEIKIGIFSVGILVKIVMILQYRKLNNTPFEKKLRGLNINADHIKKLYIEALEKLSQYLSSGAYQDLREFIAKYFITNSYLLSKMSNDEISFYFVSGMEIAKSFSGELEEELQ